MALSRSSPVVSPVPYELVSHPDTLRSTGARLTSTRNAESLSEARPAGASVTEKYGVSPRRNRTR